MPADSTSSSSSTSNGLARIELPAIAAIGFVVVSSLATLLLTAFAKTRIHVAGCDDEVR
jgi:hypothetical protein